MLIMSQEPVPAPVIACKSASARVGFSTHVFQRRVACGEIIANRSTVPWTSTSLSPRATAAWPCANPSRRCAAAASAATIHHRPVPP